jgi:hypothetical protein
MKKVKFLFYGVILLISVIMVSCYPGGAEYYSDTDVVITDYDSVFFETANVKTYFLVDTVAYQTDDQEEVEHKYDKLILDQIEQNLDMIGYTPVDTSTHVPPDVLITVTVTTSTSQGWVPSYPYYPGWDWWWGYPGWDWWWGYPGGYYPYYYSFSTGTLFITMGDPNHPIDDNGDIKLPVVWGAAFNGMLSSSNSDMSNRIKKAIDQAFSQSKCFK